MTCEYKVDGCIQVDLGKPGLTEAVAALKAQCEEWFGHCCEVELEGDELTLHLYDDQCFYSTPEEFGEAIAAFASEYAVEPTQIYLEYNGDNSDDEDDPFIVGPKGFDRTAYLIKLAQSHITHWTLRKLDLEKKHAAEKGA